MQITGGAPAAERVNGADLDFLREVYVIWLEADVGEVVCSTRTFREHLDFNVLIAGPWKWTIADGTQYGDVRLFNRRGRFIGVMTVSGMVIH